MVDDQVRELRVTGRILDVAQVGTRAYLGDLFGKDNLPTALLDDVGRYLREWLMDSEIDRLSPNLKSGIGDAIESGQWANLVAAFGRRLNFGTGGIRGLMAVDKKSVEALLSDGIDARILKGPNTLNNIVVLQAAYGVARYFVERPDKRSGPVRAVVGFDSRVLGPQFARLIVGTFLAEGLEVYLFDDSVPYPEVTFAIPHLRCDFGVFISASHNDYRYNGFKMSGANGAQIHYSARNEIIQRIQSAPLAQIVPVALDSAESTTLERLHFLGGSAPLADRPYFGREGSLNDVHSALVRQIKGFLLRPELFDPQAGSAKALKIVYAAFNGAGRVVVPRLLNELGFQHVHRIRSLDPLNGLFPAFESAAGREQQPDPGDPRSAMVAMRELESDQAVGKDAAGQQAISWADADLLIGTDPDADRCGVVVKPPAVLVPVFARIKSARYAGDRVLVPADDMWAVIVWYRLQYEIEKFGSVRNAATRFIAMSHTTSDVLARLAMKHGIGVLKTWVGFGWLSTGVSEVWSGRHLPETKEGRELGRHSESAEPCHRVFHDTTQLGTGRSDNIAALEQSNGFSILGRAPAHPEWELGIDGHVRDKDGTFAACLVAEVAAFARAQGTDILSILANQVYSDPAVGLFANYYEPDPLDGEYPGVAGDRKKARILDRALALAGEAQAGGLTLGGRFVTGCSVYWTGKYDVENKMLGFPDEGIRMFLGSELDHFTIRPSGTTNSLRFHVQLRGGAPSPSEAWTRRLELEIEARMMVDEVRGRIGAERFGDSVSY